ncbi:hypothetical protein DKX38_027748 [Salix brachista]|uniref:non-specific serine/threonine protein kinase n=1 Tax=Salix brachista TaxID=2182728 RepID=A0A5N5J545_9ROSI|nr:hypothetical protein DKX38_027748 [Salix brachista]
MHLARHPNIVELKEVMATKTKIFFIMEYVRGGELFAKVAKGRLGEEAARKYFQQLISAIDYCHSRGVYHRDLKPENLLLGEDENLKISDFGLSALREQFLQDKLLHTLCGTPAYVAPEVLRKKGYDGSKADIWSCGVILYVLLAGFLPFQDENVMKMYRKIFRAEYEFQPWFSADARRLISRFLVADPDRRITIPAMMRNHWFLKGFSRPMALSIQESIMDMNVQDQELDSCSAVAKPKVSSPKFFNAFELISSMSSGFDLSGLFETEKKPGSIFTSKVSASPWEGRKGRLAVTAEVFEVAPEVAVVEFSKSSGDTLEYAKFCEEDVRPGLKDIVWTWHGDNGVTTLYAQGAIIRDKATEVFYMKGTAKEHWTSRWSDSPSSVLPTDVSPTRTKPARGYG